MNLCKSQKPTIIDTTRLNKLRWFGQVQRTEENRIPIRVLYINLETTRLRRRQRKRCQNEVKQNVRLVGGEGWNGKLHKRGMEKAPDNGKESSNSAHANRMNE